MTGCKQIMTQLNYIFTCSSTKSNDPCMVTAMQGHTVTITDKQKRIMMAGQIYINYLPLNNIPVYNYAISAQLSPCWGLWREGTSSKCLQLLDGCEGWRDEPLTFVIGRSKVFIPTLQHMLTTGSSHTFPVFCILLTVPYWIWM